MRLAVGVMDAHKVSLRPRVAPSQRIAGVRRATSVRRLVRVKQSFASTAATTEQVSSSYPRPLPAGLSRAVEQFSSVLDPKERYKLLLQKARSLAPYPEEHMTAANRVMGCTAQVWIHAELDSSGKVQFHGTSDSALTKGLCGVLCEALSGVEPQQVMDLDPEVLLQLNLGPAVMSRSRVNGFANMLETMKRRTRMLVKDLPRFPSLLITASSLTPRGAFAEAQARYLQPNDDQVDTLAQLFRSKKIGVVAHFYMDPEVQGVLTSAQEQWPHIHISDSLVMADTAVKMAEAGCRYICVLGVDFMSENVRAILDEAGYQDVVVYRMSSQDIGCSLAEAAQSPQYYAYLGNAAMTPTSMHVIYINTSLRTKALANELVPTITCTSSNVVQTILQGFAQVPDLVVWYGPDTYMGRNLAQLFTSLADMTDEDIQALHPAHNRASIKAILPRLRYFENGTCIVHHIFGGEVCELVQAGYSDAYLTAHLEVPGEMFTLAMQAKKRGMGVVGSTSNILDFIVAKLGEALERPYPDRLQFVLGTEAGMITSIVRRVQRMLVASGRTNVEVEVVFPVAPQAITTSKQTISGPSGPIELPTGLSVLPGPATGEGCSLEGGCAACPYMKMNTLAALRYVCEKVGVPAGEQLLASYQPQLYPDLVGGKTIAQAGCTSILNMRYFQSNKRFSEQFVKDIKTRNQEVSV